MKNIDIFLTEVRAFLKPDQIKLEKEDLEFFAQDWSRILTPSASCILFPRNTLEVSEILKRASFHQIPVVPSGGRTGLSGGAVATQGEVVLSLTQLNFIGPIHLGAHTLRVGAGAITEAVHDFCKPEGLTWPVDFASKGSSTVGGNIATNAGGVRVIRYGNTRNWVLSLTLVTMDGEVLELNHELEKNNTGYDLRQLVIGSEGTLGVITEATLKLCALPQSTLVFFFSCETFSSLLKLFTYTRAHAPHLSAFECLDHASLALVTTHFNKKPPLKTPGKVYALVEFENTSFEEATDFLENIFKENFILDGVMAQNEKEAQELWSYREGVAESILHAHVVHQEDVSVPVSKLDAFYEKIEARYAEAFPEFKVFFFGHIGDGNLHIFIQKPETMESKLFIEKAKKSDLELFHLLSTFQGSVSAEHGIGLLKKHAIGFTRSNPDLALMKKIKHSFDPQHLMNPGKII